MIPLRKFQFNFVILSEFDGIVLSVFLGGFHIGFVIRCYTSGIWFYFKQQLTTHKRLQINLFEFLSPD